MAEPTRPRKSKVAILGFAPHYTQAPFADPDCEIWGVNQLHQFIPRADRWFELHRWEVVLAENALEAAAAPHGVSRHMEWMKTFPGPIYMIESRAEIPSSVTYPLDTLVHFAFPWATKLPDGRWDDAYFRCSASYMLALAIFEGFAEIHIYGVDMAQVVEYREQRPSCEYFLGLATGKGIKVVRPPDSNLLRAPYLYGFDDERARGFKADCQKRKTYMEQQMAAKRAEFDNAKQVLDQYSGAIQDLDYMLLTHAE